MATICDSFDYLFNGVFKALKGSQLLGTNHIKIDPFRQGSLISCRAVAIAMGFEPSFPMRLGIAFRKSGASGKGGAGEGLSSSDKPRFIF